MDGDEARLLAVLLRAADRHGVQVSHRQVLLLAGEVAAWLRARERPVDDEPVVARRGGVPGSTRVAGAPTVEQLRVLVEKTRSRALTGAEVERLSAGLEAVRPVGGSTGPLRVACGRCGAGVGDVCRTVGGYWVRAHRERVVAWTAA